MTFEDCQADDIISLTLKNDGKKFTTTSKIINVIDGCLVVEPFKFNNAILEIPANIDIEMLVIPEGDVPYMWQRVSVELKLYHDENVHVIKSKLPGVRMNRRGNYRLFLGSFAKMSDGASQQPFNVTLKDVSNSGFAILVDKSIEIPLHSKITVEYLDQPMQKYFELAGRPIRKLEQDPYMLYGCILDRRYPELENYITQKQTSLRPNSRKKQSDKHEISSDGLSTSDSKLEIKRNPYESNPLLKT